LPGKGYISPGEIAQRLNMLVIHCDRCGRRGQYPLWKLIAKYGTEASIEPLRTRLPLTARYAPIRRSSFGKGCAPVCPELSKVF
jgi:hypothetical protein